MPSIENTLSGSYGSIAQKIKQKAPAVMFTPPPENVDGLNDPEAKRYFVYESEIQYKISLGQQQLFQEAIKDRRQFQARLCNFYTELALKHSADSVLGPRPVSVEAIRYGFEMTQVLTHYAQSAHFNKLDVQRYDEAILKLLTALDAYKDSLPLADQQQLQAWSEQLAYREQWRIQLLREALVTPLRLFVSDYSEQYWDCMRSINEHPDNATWVAAQHVSQNLLANKIIEYVKEQQGDWSFEYGLSGEFVTQYVSLGRILYDYSYQVWQTNGDDASYDSALYFIAGQLLEHERLLPQESKQKIMQECQTWRAVVDERNDVRSGIDPAQKVAEERVASEASRTAILVK